MTDTHSPLSGDRHERDHLSGRTRRRRAGRRQFLRLSLGQINPNFHPHYFCGLNDNHRHEVVRGLLRLLTVSLALDLCSNVIGR